MVSLPSTIIHTKFREVIFSNKNVFHTKTLFWSFSLYESYVVVVAAENISEVILRNAAELTVFGRIKIQVRSSYLNLTIEGTGRRGSFIFKWFDIDKLLGEKRTCENFLIDIWRTSLHIYRYTDRQTESQTDMAISSQLVTLNIPCLAYKYT